MNIGRLVTGYMTVEVTGAQPERFLQALAERGMSFWDAAPPKNFTMRLCMPSRWRRLAGPIGQSVGCQVEVLSCHGLPALWQKLKRRRALLLGLALAGALLGASRFFVWDIRIEGAEELDQSALRAALAEAGVDVGAYWPAFRQDMIRNAVMLRMPGLRWLTVNTQGSRAVVIVRQAREAPELVDESEPARIVADRAGIVTQVLDKRGTALVKEGQTVLPGEVLIDGVATGRYETFGATRAIGEVWARTWYELTAAAPSRTMEKEYSGGGYVRWSLVWGKRRIPLYSGGSMCPEGYEKEERVYTLAAEGIGGLPLGLVAERYTAYDTRQTEGEAQTGFLEQALVQALGEALGEDGEVLSAEYTQGGGTGYQSMTLRAECLQQIGVTEPSGVAPEGDAH